MTNIILCGGNGTRLWPISRTFMPKQFVKLFNEQSLFQTTLKRNKKLIEKFIVVSNTEQYFLALDQYEELKMAQTNVHQLTFILEPMAKNTAPAIALACLSLPEEAIVLVTPSDHLIKNEEAYGLVIQKAKALASNDFLVTFGIAPTHPETGFGYIEFEGENVSAFHEKPNIETAKHYLTEGNYYWNSGMFCFKAGVFLEELKRYAPKIYTTCKEAFENALVRDNTIRFQQEHVVPIPEDSIDYAIMEKSSKVKMVASDIGWNDIGSFDALHQELPKDSNNNTLNSDIIDINARNNLVLAHKKVALVDVNDLVVVATDDALLISKQGSSQRVKEAVARLKSENSELSNIHLTVYRPWGSYTVLENSDRYKIKRIKVKPKKRLSLQKHFHRNEHWIVVNGTAIVQVGDKEEVLRANESTYIHVGVQHRLENQGNIDLVLIEVQVGEYLGEDDIVRIEDDFNRGV